MKNSILLLLYSLLLSSCSNVTKEVVIDNPTEEELLLVFNGKTTVSISPNSKESVLISFGKNSVTVNGNQAVEIILDEKNDYLLNPALQTYYVEEQLFFTSQEAQEEYFRYNKSESEVEGLTIGGNFQKIEGQFAIPKFWKYGLDEASNGSLNVRTRKKNKTYHSVKKIHRQKDIREMLKAETRAFTEEAFEKLIKEEAKKKVLEEK